MNATDIQGAAWGRLHETDPFLAEVLVDAVGRGAAFLDRAAPGWAWRIEADRLAMESCDHCVLGQLYGDYTDGWRLLVSREDCRVLFRASAYGFSLPIEKQNLDREDEDVILLRFAALAAIWRAQVRARSKGGAA